MMSLRSSCVSPPSDVRDLTFSKLTSIDGDRVRAGKSSGAC